MLVSLVSIGGSCYTRVSSPFSMNSFHAVWVTDTPQCIISARCPVLMNEFANQSTVRLVDIDAELLSIFIGYLYTDSVPHLSSLKKTDALVRLFLYVSPGSQGCSLVQ